MGIGAKIKSARGAAGWSQAKLAEEINQAQTTISSWERGRTEPTREDVERVADVLGLAPAQLEAPSVMPATGSPRTVPLIGYVGAGARAVLFGEGQGPFGEAPWVDGANADTVAVEIRGESLGSFFNEWLVYYDNVERPVTRDLIGKLCVVGLPDSRVLVKKLKESPDPNRFHLLSQTEDPILDVEVVWAAKVKTMTPR